MKKTLCMYFQVHLPAYLRDYKFFDMGHSVHYFDEFKIKNNMEKLAAGSYLPLNNILQDIIKSSKNQFKIAFSITGEAIEQMEKYAPEVLLSFKKLAKTGCVEFVNETYSHSLIFLKDEKEFKIQVDKNAEMIRKHFGQTPTTLRMTGMIYSDQIGEMAARMGYETMLTDDAKHVMGWKSPNNVYTNNGNKDMKLLLRNSQLSERISFYFADQTKGYYPVTADKMVTWLDNEKGDMVNIFMDFAAFGYRHHESTGIFEFMKYLPSKVLEDGSFEFMTPSEVVKKHAPVGSLEVPYPISWYEAERDLSIWLGNDMQKDAFEAMYDLGDRIRFVDDADITHAWKRLQDSDHFYFMCTRWQEDQSGRRFRSPYNSAYDAYINYMNVLSDLTHRLDNELDKQLKKLMEDDDFAIQICRKMNLNHINYTAAQVKKIIEMITIEQDKRMANKKKTTKKATSGKTTTTKKKEQKK